MYVGQNLLAFMLWMFCQSVAFLLLLSVYPSQIHRRLCLAHLSFAICSMALLWSIVEGAMWSVHESSLRSGDALILMYLTSAHARV
jgi:hypothetical protein